MNAKKIQFRLGLGAVLFAAFLVFYLVPFWVTAPDNVPRIVLSPIFWPIVLAGVLALVGLGLLFSSRTISSPAAVTEDNLVHRPTATAQCRVCPSIFGPCIDDHARHSGAWASG
jgi:hypothetical protein